MKTEDGSAKCRASSDQELRGRAVLTPQEAERAGYVALTNAFHPVMEKGILLSAWWTLRGCTVCLVRYSYGVEIWRHRREMTAPWDSSARFCGEASRGQVGRDPKRKEGA